VSGADDQVRAASETDEDVRRTVEVPRTRPCLRCAEPFLSAWSGERICRRCKSSASWRQGIAHNPSGGRRR
jgi:hypothetical protein